ncbi:hypothetical protein Pla123a_06550 [Posidoniimonas polymericola]|uniref:Ice-binding protein C-terminal domain-containing protein n=1 Tax=Posidoniimonas polymericola TaxID=2528002 RepID=A0A5C5ZF93_9BACT|nr:PEP-CTERM sorting domain-containing protein [Posidoniimonas polymericola]TWT85848.1 hypothetical protein Pla123a_06550 [Posidoniimonas polymericola]
MKPLVASFLIALCTAATAPAVTVFLGSSPTDPTATGPLTMGVGDTAELYIWVTRVAGIKVTGASFDIVATPNGTLQATDISIANPVVFGRPAWDGIKQGDLNTNGHLVDGSLAVAVISFGLGINLEGFYRDPRNFGANLNHGVLSIEALAPGTTSVYAAPNAVNPFTVWGQGAVAFDAPAFSITVTPEPATAGLAGLALAALGSRRRR